jgi:RalA-binding protein 1
VCINLVWQRGGTHLGSIAITGSQIGRQQTTGDKPTGDEEKEYRHAFLIVEAKRGPGGSHPRHVLCAESDADRDGWVEILVRYVTGSYNEDPILALGPPINTNEYTGRSSTSSYDNGNVYNNRRPAARPPRDEILKGPSLQVAASISSATLVEEYGENSPVKSVDPSPIDRPGPGVFSDAQVARKILERGYESSPLSSSLPSSSPLDNPNGPSSGVGQRANSELGHYTDMVGYGRHPRDHSPENRRRDHHGDSKALQPTPNTVTSSPSSSGHAEPRAPSPSQADVNGKAKISGPIGGAPIPAGYKFGSKDATSDSSATAAERREKAKSRSFWGFGRPNGGKLTLVQTFPSLGVDLTSFCTEKPPQPTATMANRAVFGVPLEDSLDVVQIASLPAVVFRCIQYLEAKKADQEEGIYRLSGSSAVIKSLKDRFNIGAFCKCLDVRKRPQ